MIVFNEQQHISMVSRQTIAAVRVQGTTSHKWNWIIVYWHVDGADCCLIGIVLGFGTTKNVPPIPTLPIPVNIAQYPITQYQYRSNPIQQFIKVSFALFITLEQLVSLRNTGINGRSIEYVSDYMYLNWLLQCGWEWNGEQDVPAEPGHGVRSNCTAPCRQGVRGSDDGGTVLFWNTWCHDADIYTDDIPQPPQERSTVLNCLICFSFCSFVCDIIRLQIASR